MTRRCCLVAIVLLTACGRLDFAVRPDASDALVGDGMRLRYTDAVIASRPRAYYRLAEIGGSVVRDSTGNHDAVYEVNLGLIQYRRTGALTEDNDAAVRFDGDGNAGPNISASVADLEGILDWGGDYTVEMFYAVEALAPQGHTNVVFVCENYLINGFRLGWNQYDHVHLWTTQSGATGSLEPAVPMTMGEFHHVALVQAGGVFTLHVDAVLIGSGAVDYIPASTDSTCGFGSFQGMPSYATYDEVALYDRALPQSEITAHLEAR